jgi:hypothetical protein
LEDIIDWDSEKGKLIKEAREKSGKWTSLPIEASKYIVSVYYPDLIGRKGEAGVAERGKPMFRHHPESGEAFFEKLPDWMYRDIMKQCETFTVKPKE